MPTKKTEEIDPNKIAQLIYANDINLVKKYIKPENVNTPQTVSVQKLESENVDEFVETPFLHIAIAYFRREIVDWLIKIGANPKQNATRIYIEWGTITIKEMLGQHELDTSKFKNINAIDLANKLGNEYFTKKINPGEKKTIRTHG